MKYYLCQTPEGPQYVVTQIEAAKLDPNFTTVELDLGKKAIMDRLNDLMRRAHVNENPRRANIGENPANEIVLETPESSDEKPKPKKGMGPAEERINRAWDQIAIEQFVHDVPADERFRLDGIEKCIRSRREEIERGQMGV